MAERTVKMLRTWEFGEIEIVDSITKFDTYIRDDVTGEYSYYQTAEGYIIAVCNE